MNLLLLEPGELAADGTATLSGRRLRHARDVLRAQVQDELRVGVLGGSIGRERVLELGRDALRLSVTLSDAPPARARIDLLLAMPRPKAFKRIVAAVASLGVDRVVLINAARVEPSYFDSKVLDAAFLAEHVALGLEQARDTIAPTFAVEQRFKPFVEDRLRAWLVPGTRALIPHPVSSAPLRPVASTEHVTLAIGPDGGWVPFEVELLTAHGFTPVSLGPRILRGEVAVPTIIGAVRAAG